MHSFDWSREACWLAERASGEVGCKVRVSTRLSRVAEFNYSVRIGGLTCSAILSSTSTCLNTDENFHARLSVNLHADSCELVFQRDE